MNIVVLGGSPKGSESVTMQYTKYLKNKNTEFNFTEYYVAKDIKNIEKNSEKLEEIMENIKSADGVIWAFPLYFGLVHGSYKRFIEIIFEKGLESYFDKKQCSIIATSIHFFDHTAIEYIRGISEDLGMTVGEIYSASMRDLLEIEKRKQFEKFFTQWSRRLKENIITSRVTTPIRNLNNKYNIDNIKNISKYDNGKIAIITESGVSENLDNMVLSVTKKFKTIKIFDISEIKVLGGCLGCLKCGYENKCTYEGKDEVIEIYKELLNYDAIIFAGTMIDRFFSSKWKTFIDRLFFTTHIPIFSKKYIGFIISGPLSQNSNMREVLTGFFETMEVTVTGIVTDEGECIEEKLDGFANTMDNYIKTKYYPPRQFLGEAGHKIFRDEIYSNLKGVFIADHKYYKKNGMYDFPQKKLKDRVVSRFMYFGMKIPSVRKHIQQNMVEYMIKPYEQLYKK